MAGNNRHYRVNRRKLTQCLIGVNGDQVITVRGRPRLKDGPRQLAESYPDQQKEQLWELRDIICRGLAITVIAHLAPRARLITDKLHRSDREMAAPASDSSG